ncbi:hypothetical protein A3H10_02990 [Candidatus Uhrbacteria bacterium RIFCSPLOWO2_12_FULL_46_10]|uniref:TrbC/VIRB2 family protein n=1 Tax=Candidatus Uhrbacteria bacterium RIFCSPLOWO2_01_FULL_47_25 TaxID=1802402 RepID=A0A1F7UXT7_9BACT|nr:MAG: hypothetical protein UX68_C0028G0003 [Parcubacteria group bacterium GW2011_GWA2_46_9]OGL59756.1 MAG: hypothetical protein A2752_03145 [Candidatus Uhrbacteria bacterium RIFCSPHIGHO2_01_FULL_46_23]OGL70552.1 MAG: hypothetical protein A3D60_03715 [Candidatus Uhrbacteria bacterium RIFCSPHIGHO2_02_FULL_47_29]OGL75808.1 MAG: hypothetical protein A3E96_02655 [Candidatus Uhrbacteria bacterium RIFCSPHIGHO2_12_FULL_46_13]OGL83085.1 MAG: hypothetical protein A2936_05220 [Candidatus Uhrbacteria bac
MKRIINSIILSIVVGSGLLLATPVLAASPAEKCPIDPSVSFANVLRRVACTAGFIPASDTSTPNEGDIARIIGTFINIALGFAGVVFVVLILYGGWLWGSARGNEEQVQEAEKLIRNAVLGIIIVFAVFTISRFVISAMELGFTNRV